MTLYDGYYTCMYVGVGNVAGIRLRTLNIFLIELWYLSYQQFDFVNMLYIYFIIASWTAMAAIVQFFGLHLRMQSVHVNTKVVISILVHAYVDS